MGDYPVVTATLHTKDCLEAAEAYRPCTCHPDRAADES